MRWRSVLVVIPLLFLTSCTEIAHFLGLDKDYFADYRGVNLLKEFDLPKWTTSTMGLVTAGVDDYMTWEPVTTETAPDGKSPVYRVEIKNLLPNGDFEAGSLGSYWSTVDAINANIYTALAVIHPTNQQGVAPGAPIPSNRQSLDHQSLLFTANDGGDFLVLNLNQALGSLWTSGSYRFRMTMENVTTFTELHTKLTNPLGDLKNTEAFNNGRWERFDLKKIDEAQADTLSKFFTVSSSSDLRNLMIGDNIKTDAALLDNFRVIREDLDLSAVAFFPSLEILPNIPLLPGQASKSYTFKIYIKDDVTADQTSSSGTHFPNRFYPQGVTVKILGKAKKDIGSQKLTSLAEIFIPRPLAGWPGWTMITHSETVNGTATALDGLSGGLDFVTSDTDLEGSNALEIHISPTNRIDESLEGMDAGSLLLAQPTLTFNP